MPNIMHDPIVNRDKIVFLPLHIKVDLMKQFLKAHNTNGNCFQYLIYAFSKLSYDNINADVFDGPHIRLLVHDKTYVEVMNNREKVTWLSFVEEMQNFLGNIKAENYQVLVVSMLLAFRDLECSMSIKLHFLEAHLDKFPDNLGAVSDEQCERYHQDLKTMELRYQGRWDKVMMADYCWNIMRDCQEEVCKRKSYKRKFLPG